MRTLGLGLRCGAGGSQLAVAPPRFRCICSIKKSGCEQSVGRRTAIGISFAVVSVAAAVAFALANAVAFAVAIAKGVNMAKVSMAKGVTVPGRLVCIYFRQGMTKNDECVPPDVLELARQYLAKHEKDSTRRSWVCRWRQRWGFGVKALPSHKLEFTEITRRKVEISKIRRTRF